MMCVLEMFAISATAFALGGVITAAVFMATEEKRNKNG